MTTATMPDPRLLGRTADGQYRWQVRPYVGEPRRRATRVFLMPSSSLKAARRKAADVVRELEDEAGKADTYAPTVGKLLDDWIARNRSRLAPRTVVGYTARAAVIRKHIGNLRADAVTVDDVSAMYHALREKGTTEATLLEVHRVLSAAFQWAHDMERIAAVPNLRRVKPKHTPPEIDPPSSAELRRLLTSLPDTEWARAIALLPLGGMRRGEVVGLRWEDVTGPTFNGAGDLVEFPTVWVRHSVTTKKGEPVHVGPTKSKRDRLVTLPVEAFAVLEQQRQYVLNADGKLPAWVFPCWSSRRRTLPRNPDSISRAWDRHRKKHELPNVRVHDLRHYYATAASEAGISFRVIADQLGHTDPALTIRLYSHTTASGRGSAALAVAASIGELDLR